MFRFCGITALTVGRGSSSLMVMLTKSDSAAYFNERVLQDHLNGTTYCIEKHAKCYRLTKEEKLTIYSMNKVYVSLALDLLHDRPLLSRLQQLPLT